MGLALRQSTASQEIPLGHFVSDSDGKTAETGLTIANTDILVWKAGASALVAKNSGGGTHMAAGVYSAVLDATDTDTVGPLVIFVQVTGALPVRLECEVYEEAVFDALFAASATGLLPANVTQFGGTNGTFAAGRPEVNTTHAAGTAWGSGAITAGAIASNAITDAKINSGAFTAAKFASGAFDAVWSVAARLLTAGTNIVLAKGTGVTGFTDLDAAGVRGAVGLASANLDTQLSAIDGVVDDIKAKTDNLPSDPADQSLIIAATDGILSAIGDVPTNAELATALAGADDAVLAALATVDGNVDDIKAKTDNLPSDPADQSLIMAALGDLPTAAENADAVHDEAVEGDVSMRQLLRGFASALFGNATGLLGPTGTFRDLADTKDRIVADIDGDARDVTALDLD